MPDAPIKNLAGLEIDFRDGCVVVKGGYKMGFITIPFEGILKAFPDDSGLCLGLTIESIKVSIMGGGSMAGALQSTLADKAKDIPWIRVEGNCFWINIVEASNARGFDLDCRLSELSFRDGGVTLVMG